MITYANKRVDRTGKLKGFVQLAKLRVYYHAYEWLIAALLLNMQGIRPPGAIASLILFLVAMFAVQAAACAVDDIIGFRDGSDVENYRQNDLLPQPRKLLPKPLLTGALTERESMVFAAVAAVTATIAAVGSLLVVDAPAASPLGYVIVLACAVQYSWGLKLSYRPGGLEFVIIVVNAATILLPYWWIAHRVTLGAAIMSAVVCGWTLLVISYGNAADRDGDEASGRRTIAVLAGPRTYQAYLVLVYLVSVTLNVLPFALGLLRPIGILFVLPLLAMQTVQLYWGVIRGDARRAMKLGMRCYDLGGLGFACAILLT
ncbi:MAG TPA: UbiA family prenyltransferase [Pseudonocardiaceae bacterium]|nr:UbiA family prenyltransferase [Pseudonocardiaceae bacterium]